MTSYLERQILTPTRRAEAEKSSALRSIRRSHREYKYRHLKAPGIVENLSNESLANMAFRHARELGGTEEDITKNAKQNYEFLIREKKIKSGRQGRAILEAIKSGAAEVPSTINPTRQQLENIKQNKTWYLTKQQAKIRAVKEGAIKSKDVRDFMIGKYTPETRKKLDEILATPQSGPPDKFASGRSGVLEKVVGGLSDVLSTFGRGSGGAKAVELKEARETGALEEQARGGRPSGTFFGSPIKQIPGGAKAALKMEGAPNLEAEILRNREYLMQMAMDDARKELPSKLYSEEDILKRAETLYENYKYNLGRAGKSAIENPDKAAMVYEIGADPIMYVGGAPYKLGAAAVSKAVPQAAKMALAKGAQKGLGWMSYRAKFLPLEQMGDEGKKLAEGLRFAETNLGPGAKAKVDEMAEQAHNLYKRVKEEDTKLFFDVVHKKRPIEELPEYLKGIVPQTKSLSDELYNLKVEAGTAQTLVSPKGAYVEELAGTGKIGDKLARELNYTKLNIGDEAADELSSHWTDIRSFAKDKKLKRKESNDLLKYIDGSRKTLPKRLSKNANTSRFARETRDSVEALRDEFGIPAVGSGKIVQKAAYLEDYGSPLLMQEKGFGTGAQRKYKGVTTGSAMHRTGKGAPVEDVGKQFQYALEAESKTASRAAAYTGIKQASKEADVWHVWKPTKKGPALEDELLGKTPTLEDELLGAEIAFNNANQSGIPFKALDDTLTEKILQVTEPPGTIISKGTRIMVPEPVEQTILRVAEAFSMPQSVQAIGDLYKGTFRPMQNIWRINATVLRSPVFLATNFVGAIGLGMLAHGLKALNPKLQRGAIRTAALAAFGGSSKALTTQFKLASGEVKTLGELYNLMRDVGIIGQYKKRYAMEMLGTGKLGKLEQLYRKIPQKLGVQQLAAFGDEYQHAVTFLGALKSTRPDDIMRAADFTAKFAGNYNRLTYVERTFLKEIAGFYTWNRFILPHVTKQIFENPQRLAVWEKLKQGWEAYYGANRPVFEAGVPEWLKLQTTATAPESMQPDSPHETAMITLETPQNTLGALVGEGAVPFMLGPGVAAMTELITGIDLKSGRRRPDIEPYMPNAIETKEGLINLAEKSLPFGEAVSNLGKLYWDWGYHGAAAETWLKYRVARDWLNLDRLATWQKPLGIPVLTKTHVFQSSREAARKKRRALGD